tara:strand:+ start:1780 stop:1932 length:153 start_codon:yes stop_codon:yes gene_type:complete
MNKNDEHLITRLTVLRDMHRFSAEELQTLDAAIEALRIVATVIGADANKE